MLVERFVVENLGSDTCAVDGGVGVERADEDLDLRVDAFLLLGIFADNGECANALTV